MNLQCKHCRKFVRPSLRRWGELIQADCPNCGRRIERMKPTPEVLAEVGPAPKPSVSALAPDLFGTDGY